MEFLAFSQTKLGSSTLSPAHGLGGARATILSFLYSVPPSARKKFWPSNRAGKKEGGWGEGIFARPSVQFLPREARQSVGVSFKIGSSFVQQLRQFATNFTFIKL